MLALVLLPQLLHLGHQAAVVCHMAGPLGLSCLHLRGSSRGLSARLLGEASGRAWNPKWHRQHTEQVLSAAKRAHAAHKMQQRPSPGAPQTAAHLSPQSLLLLLNCGQVGHQLAIVALLMLQLQTQAKWTCQPTRKNCMCADICT